MLGTFWWVLICLVLLPFYCFAPGGGPSPKNNCVGDPSKVITLPVTFIRGPFLKITTRISSGGAAYGLGPQPLCRTTAGSPPPSNAGTNARAESKTLFDASGLTQSTILVAPNVNSDLLDTGAGSAFHWASPSKITIQLNTLVRSGSVGSTMKQYRCPEKAFSGDASPGIKPLSGVRQAISSASFRRAIFSCSISRSLSFSALSNCLSCSACRSLILLPVIKIPAPKANVKNSNTRAPISKKPFSASTDIETALHNTEYLAAEILGKHHRLFHHPAPNDTHARNETPAFSR
jgi:hypothetical protein